MRRRTRVRQRSTRVELDSRIEVEKLVRAEVEKLVPSTVQGNRGDKPQIERRPMTLLEAIGAGTGMNGQPAGFIPFARDPQDNNAFGPGHPLLPAPVDAPDPTDGQPPPRVFEYDVSWNLPGNGQREVPWQVLRIASTAVDIIRRCIEYRKRTMRGLKPRWVVSAEAIQEAYESSPDAGRENAEQTLRAKYADKIKDLTAFWREPWRQNGLDFGQWLNMIMEEHIVLDAVAVYPRRALDGTVLDFQVLDGSTIKPLLSVQGARPSPPHPAFQQVLYGFPRGEYGAAVDPKTGELKPGYSTAQLFYHRENVRANSPYGLSPVEQALIAARLYLKRQGWMLAEYDDGSTPVTWIIPSEDEERKAGQAFTPPIRRAYEDGLNEEMGGSTRRRHRAKVLPPGWQAIQTQSVDERYKPDYDLHLIKLLCGFFNVPITELGFSEAKGIGNSGLHEGMADVADKVSDRPDAEVLGSMITKLARQFQGCPAEVELQFVPADSKDTLEESQADDLKYKGGVLTLNDLRRKAGLPVFNFPEADMPYLVGIGPSGVTFIEGLHEQQKAVQESQLALTNTQVGAGQAQIEQTQADVAAVGAQDMADENVQKELTAFNRWRRRNPDSRRPFLFKAATPDDVDQLFELDPNAMEFDGWIWEPDLDKGAGWDAGVKRFRDNRGRFVRGLKLDAALDHLDEVVSQLHRGRKVRRGENPRTDALHAAGLLEDSPDRVGELQLSDAGRQHLVDRAPQDYAEQLSGTSVLDQIEADGGTVVPTASVEDARGATLDDKIRRAEVMYGSGRSKWPAAVLAEERKIKMREAAKVRRAERMRKIETQEAQHVDLTDRAPVEPLSQLDTSSSVQAMEPDTTIKLTPTRRRTLEGIHARAEAGQHAVNAARQKGLDSRAIDTLIRDDLVEYVPGQSNDLQPWEKKIQLTAKGRRHLAGIATTAGHTDLTPDAPEERQAAQAAKPSTATSPELVSQIQQAETRQAAMDLARHRGESETRTPETVDWDIEAAGRLWDARHDVAARRALRERGEAITADSLRAEVTRQRVEGAAREPKAIEGAVRESVQRRANRGGWAGIADIRDDLAAAGYTRDEQDNALRAMMNQPDVRIIPVADRKNLRPRDREAALVVGRDDLTAIQIGGDPSVPEVRTEITRDDLIADLAARERQLQLDLDAGAGSELIATHREAIAGLREQIRRRGGIPMTIERATAHPFGAHAEAPEMEPSDRNGERVTIHARDTEDYGTIVGRRGPQHAGAGNNFLVVRHDDGTYQSYDSRVVHAQSSATGLELADQARQAQTREAAMAPAEPRRFTADQLRELPWSGATREQIIEHGRKHGLSEADIDAELAAFGTTRERQPGEAVTLGPIGLAHIRQREERDAYLRAQTPKIIDAALGDGPTAVTHAPSRAILTSMRDQGWMITDVDLRTRVMTLESPDGERQISMQVNGNGKTPTWWHGQSRITLKRANEIVG